MKSRLFKKILWLAGLLILLSGLLLARPVFHITRTLWNDRDEIVSPPPGKINDASRLNETAVQESWKIPGDAKSAEAQLTELLHRARTSHLKVSIAGAQHSMGAHTIAKDGVVIDMLPFNRMELDAAGKILHVQAGARWSEVIPFLNAHGLSVEIMQSNDDFSIGGSISVNCHGWQFNRPPIASSVESFRLMLADGSVVKCSRMENRELFSLVLGGYGLFGIILDVDLQVVPNQKYRIERVPVSAADFVRQLNEKAANAADVGMVYGRLRVTPENFLGEGIINLLHTRTDTNLLVSKLGPPKLAKLKRAIFRGSADSDYGKELRWTMERSFEQWLSGDECERNDLLFEPVSLFQNRTTNSTDILMECFVPPAQFEAFLVELRKIVPRHQADLLNITVRQINRDPDAFLRYADQDMLGLVMLFNQKRNLAGEEMMKAIAQEIITAALAHDGRYYLPYRLHATAEQFAKAYPQAQEFFQLKRKYDPEELFQNGFYQSYGKQSAR